MCHIHVLKVFFFCGMEICKPKKFYQVHWIREDEMGGTCITHTIFQSRNLKRRKKEMILMPWRTWEENIKSFTAFRLPQRLIIDVIIIPVHNYVIKHYVTKAYGEGGGSTSSSFLTSARNGVVSPISGPLYPRYTLDRRLGGPQIRSA
jgi:hypothetical protein